MMTRGGSETRRLKMMTRSCRPNKSDLHICRPTGTARTGSGTRHGLVTIGKHASGSVGPRRGRPSQLPSERTRTAAPNIRESQTKESRKPPATGRPTQEGRADLPSLITLGNAHVQTAITGPSPQQQAGMSVVVVVVARTSPRTASSPLAHAHRQSQLTHPSYFSTPLAHHSSPSSPAVSSRFQSHPS